MHPYAGSPNSGMSFRPYYISKELNKLGVTVVIISSLYHHLSQFLDAVSGFQKIEGVDYYLVKNNRYKGNGIGRVINMLTYGIRLFGYTFRRFSSKIKPDIIIVSTAHPFHIFAAKYYAKKYNAKIILEVRDIWPLSLIELAGVSSNHPFSKLIEATQNFAYRNCDFCVSLLSNAEPFFIKNGMPINSFVYIPNGIVNDENSLRNKLYYKIKSDISKFELSIGYTGAIGIPNNLMPLIKAAKKLEEYKVAIVLVGDGVSKNDIIDYIDKHDVRNVYLYDAVPKNSVSEIISLFSLMFLNAKSASIYQYGMSPNKIFDYMLKNKVVLNGVDSPNNPLQECGSEIFFESENVEDLVSKILYFKSNPYKVNTRDVTLEKYQYSTLAKKYYDLMKYII